MENDTRNLKSWVLWVLLIFLPPFGITVLWFRHNYSNLVKIIISIVFSAYFVVILFLLGNAK